MKVFEAVERQPTTIPIEAVIGSDGVPKINRAVREKGYFEIDFRGNQLVLVAGKYVGEIPINDEVVINVAPKVRIARLAELLERSNEPLRTLSFYRRRYRLTSDSSTTIFEALVTAFVEALRTLMQEGMLKNYEPRLENSSAPKGRIDLGLTLRRNMATGVFHKAYSRFYEFTPDIALNRLIKYAIWFAANHLIKVGCTNRSLMQRLHEAFEHFGAVPLDHSQQFLRQAREERKWAQLGALRAYYLDCSDIALAILGNETPELLKGGEEVRLSSFLIDMETVFENYVRNVLRTSSILSTKSVTTLDGNKEGKGWLLADSRRFEAKPDLVVRYNRECHVIGDVKYKPKLGEADRYQVISHAVSFGARFALLICPRGDSDVPGLQRIGRVGQPPGLELYTYYFDLEAVDLTLEEQALADAIVAMIGAT